jgi:autotransporter-associated beta strand protein
LKDVDYFGRFDNGAGSGLQGGDAFTSINEAVGVVAAGGTIEVFAGSYAENVNLSKSLTVQLQSDIRVTSLAGVAAASVDNGGDLLTIINGSGVNFAGSISGNGGLTKNGPGTETLSGTNTYTGDTTINGGTLLVNGSTAAGSAVAVNNGGTLGGTGTVGGSVTVNTGGTINPGTAGTVGSLTVGSLSFNGGTYQADFDPNANTADAIATAGTINLANPVPGVFSLNVLNATAPTGGTEFILIKNTGGATSNPPLTNAPENGTVSINGKTTAYTYLGGAGGNSFTLTVAGPVTYSGSGQLKLELDATGTDLQFFVGGVIQDSRPLPSITTITVNGTAPATLTLDYSNGLFLKPITFDGGTGGTLDLQAAGLAVGVNSAGFNVGGQLVTFTGVVATHINNAGAVNTIAGPDTADRATAFTGLNAQERFVQALYLDELGRAGARAELDGWVNVLNGPGMSQATIAAGIEHSPEARDHLVRSWYWAFLGRQAAGGEELGWMNQLLQGQSEEHVLSQIFASREFYARAQTLVAAGSADERYVEAMYQVLLGRTGAATEVAAWAQALPSMGAQGAAQGFLNSTEYRTDLADSYYYALLHRPADVALSGWVSLGLDAGDMRMGFESSPEFFANG